MTFITSVRIWMKLLLPGVKVAAVFSVVAELEATTPPAATAATAGCVAESNAPNSVIARVVLAVIVPTS